MDYKPHIAKVAYFVIDSKEEFDEIVDFVTDQTTEYSYRELCDGEGLYLEFEPNVLDNADVPYIGNVFDLDVNVVQIWF